MKQHSYVNVTLQQAQAAAAAAELERNNAQADTAEVYKYTT
jgi:hypothetical protein